MEILCLFLFSYQNAPLYSLFQSTLPIQGETLSSHQINHQAVISIHSPYTGRDLADSLESRRGSISIHSPYTGRDDIVYALCKWFLLFQSTLPIQGETPYISGTGTSRSISIHSPYTGRDRGSGSKEKSGSDFNPLSLYRERRLKRSVAYPCSGISIHSPYTGRDHLL